MREHTSVFAAMLPRLAARAPFAAVCEIRAGNPVCLGRAKTRGAVVHASLVLAQLTTAPTDRATAAVHRRLAAFAQAPTSVDATHRS